MAMTVDVERSPGGVVMVEVRDGCGHLVAEGRALPPDGSRSSRIAWGDETLSLPIAKDLAGALLTLIANAEKLDER